MKEDLLKDLKRYYKKLDKYDRNLLPINNLEELLGILKGNIEILEKYIEGDKDKLVYEKLGYKVWKNKLGWYSITNDTNNEIKIFIETLDRAKEIIESEVGLI